MMNSDCYFAMGKSHIVCQDYAFAGVNANGNQVAVVSDGCSSSPDTDFGARYLVRSSVICGANLKDIYDLEMYSNLILRNSIWYASQFGVGLQLSPSNLDATLLYVEADDEEVKVVVSGDGVVFAKNKLHGTLEIWVISYPSGAPLYPNYLLDNERMERYKIEYGMRKSVTKRTLGEPRLWSESLTEDEGPCFFLMLPRPDYEFVGVSSDGVHTFDLPLDDVMEQLTKFKNHTGVFVKRRMRAFLKQCQKDGIRPTDDVSMAVIYLED